MPKAKKQPESGHNIMQRPYVDGVTTAHTWEKAEHGSVCTTCGAIALDELLLPRCNCHGKPAQ